MGQRRHHQLHGQTTHPLPRLDPPPEDPDRRDGKLRSNPRPQGVPFYVCSERFKQRPPAWGDPEFEQMDPGELGAPVWAGVTVANEYFDRTPAGLISAWFDEQGQGR